MAGGCGDFDAPVGAGAVDGSGAMSMDMIARAERAQVVDVGSALVCPGAIMIEVGVDGESGASVAGAGAVLQGQPVPLRARGPVAAAVHVDDDTFDRVGDDPVECGGVEEELFRGEEPVRWSV